MIHRNANGFLFMFAESPEEISDLLEVAVVFLSRVVLSAFNSAPCRLKSSCSANGICLTVGTGPFEGPVCKSWARMRCSGGRWFWRRRRMVVKVKRKNVTGDVREQGGVERRDQRS